jgi:transposase
MNSIPRFLRNAFEGFDVVDFKEFLTDGRIDIYLQAKTDRVKCCNRCDDVLTGNRGRHPLTVEGMTIMGLRVFIHLWRGKGDCKTCGKARSERVEFLSLESPHLTQDMSEWIGKLCEVAAVSRIAELMNQDETTTWRIDLRRMQRMLQSYRIPKVTKISVDEVYARKKPRDKDESRDDRFFTVISDLETHRVIWVSESRRKEALDEFFKIIGEEACNDIVVAACDQHEGYKASVEEYCKNAVVVWDRFHIMQNFEESVNDTRKQLHSEQSKGSELQRLTRGKFRFLFLKRASTRTAEEKTHIDDVLKMNQYFAKLELIKERMMLIFEAGTEEKAKEIFNEIGEWIWQAGFKPLMDWWVNFQIGWATFKNYFKYRVSTGLSEGHNNVIKAIKRRAFGYRNMLYFRLKIMQVCGYLSSRYIASSNQQVTQK